MPCLSGGIAKHSLIARLNYLSFLPRSSMPCRTIVVSLQAVYPAEPPLSYRTYLTIPTRPEPAKLPVGERAGDRARGALQLALHQPIALHGSNAIRGFSQYVYSTMRLTRSLKPT